MPPADVALLSCLAEGSESFACKGERTCFPPGVGREGGDTSFVDGLRNMATGSAELVQSIRTVFAKQEVSLVPVRSPG